MKVGDLVKVTFDGYNAIGVVADPCWYPFPESTCYRIKVLLGGGTICIFEPFELEVIIESR